MICTFFTRKETFPEVKQMCCTCSLCITEHNSKFTFVTFVGDLGYFFSCWWDCLTMPQRRRLSIRDKWCAIVWFEEGVPIREIARRLAVNQSVIQRLRDRFINTGTVEEARRPGRPRITNVQQDRYVVLMALRDRTATANAMRIQLRATTNVNLSDQTIRNRLHEANLHSRRPAVRPRLTVVHRAARLAWSRRHLAWTRQQWSRVLFTDESRFTMSFNDGRIHVWRRPTERFQDATVREHDRYG